jgi:hypothetical protein
MINYIRHEEEFEAVIKLTSGDEIIAECLLSQEGEQSVLYVSNPCSVEVITRVGENGQKVQGVGVSKWMRFSEEEFYIIQEKDILSIAPTSKEASAIYHMFLRSEETDEEDKVDNKVEPDAAMGYINSVAAERERLERLFKKL